MMFLEFFIWGGWFVTLGIYLPNTLKATGGEIAMAYSTQSWGAIIAPFIIGLIADRFFNAEKILGVLHIIGAILMYLMYQATEFSVFYPYVLGYMIAYISYLHCTYLPTFKSIMGVVFYSLRKDLQMHFVYFGRLEIHNCLDCISLTFRKAALSYMLP